jgi:hypothetical protein
LVVAKMLDETVQIFETKTNIDLDTIKDFER